MLTCEDICRKPKTKLISRGKMGFQFLVKLCCQGKRKGERGKDQIEFQGSN